MTAELAGGRRHNIGEWFSRAGQPLDIALCRSDRA